MIEWKTPDRAETSDRQSHPSLKNPLTTQPCNVWILQVLLRKQQRILDPSKIFFGVSASSTLELFQPLDALLHSAFTVDFVVSRTHVDSVACLLLLSHHFHKQRGQKKSISRWTARKRSQR